MKVTPVILEAFAGYGHIYRQCYLGVAEGVALEKRPEKVAVLAVQRPTWSVYEADAERALAQGVGSHLAINFLDVDPYGSPFATIGGFFSSARPLPPVVELVVNDGLRQGVSMNIGWKIKELQDIIDEFGNRNMSKRYLEVAREKTRRLAAQAGYELTNWMGYYCGHAENMTHYWATLKR